MAAAIEAVDVALGGADGLDGEIAAAQDGRDREAAGIAGVAEPVLEPADVMLVISPMASLTTSSPARRVRPRSCPSMWQVHSRREFRVEVEVDQAVDLADEADGADHLRQAVSPGTCTGGQPSAKPCSGASLRLTCRPSIVLKTSLAREEYRRKMKKLIFPHR